MTISLIIGTSTTVVTNRLQRQANQNQNQIVEGYFNQSKKLVLDENLLDGKPKPDSFIRARRSIANIPNSTKPISGAPISPELAS
jgi:hypothetical protein